MQAGSRYPPVLLIHGRNDTAIPCTESVILADWLKSKGYQYQLEILEGQEHVWDLEDNETAAGGRQTAWEFLDSYANAS